MFGYRIEKNFDLAKEERRNRLIWVMGTGLCLLLIVAFFIHPFPMAIFQGYFLTALVYGDSFYVIRKDKLKEPWLWKAMFATIPIHAFFIIAILGLDRALPSIFLKIVVWIPSLTLVFGIEDVLFDGIVDRFCPSNTAKTLGVSQV
jgi:hypothetical protein